MKEEKKFTMNKEQQLFVESAWLLYENRERILNNPCMAYAPIDMQNVLMYSSPFEGATLGTYQEWWMQCDGALHTNERGLSCLMVRFCGSPLSGMNTCTMVAQDGTIEEWHSPRFHETWHHFLDIRKRYTQSKPEQPYCLEEVICRLTGRTEECMKFIHERLNKWR